MKLAQLSLMVPLAVAVLFYSAIGYAERVPEIYETLEECKAELKKIGANSKGVPACFDSTKEPTWQGKPGYGCSIESQTGQLQGEDPNTQYHEKVRRSSMWLCERLSGKKHVLYQFAEFEWVYDVAVGKRSYGNKTQEMKALWLKSESQVFYAYCSTNNELYLDKSTTTTGGSVIWSSPKKLTNGWLEPQLQFPKRHKKTTLNFFDGKGAKLPCKQADNPQRIETELNPPHNRPLNEDPAFDDGLVDLVTPFWKDPPRR